MPLLWEIEILRKDIKILLSHIADFKLVSAALAWQH